MDKIRRWAPFILMLTVAVFSFLYFLFYGDNEPYFPATDDPNVIYQEACVHCHGKNGQGDGILYPAFEQQLTVKIIEQNISEGTWLMPKFENIKGDTLRKLSEFIYGKEYLK